MQSPAPKKDKLTKDPGVNSSNEYRIEAQQQFLVKKASLVVAVTDKTGIKTQIHDDKATTESASRGPNDYICMTLN